MPLNDLFSNSGANPYSRRAQTTAALMPGSFAAKPFLAYALAKQNSRADQYDKTQGEQKTARDTLNMIFEVSKHDAVAATKMLATESAQNPLLKPFVGMTFTSETKNGYSPMKSGDGQGYYVDKNRLGETNPDGSPMTDEQRIAKGILTKIGGPDPSKTGGPKQRTAQQIQASIVSNVTKLRQYMEPDIWEKLQTLKSGTKEGQAVYDSILARTTDPIAKDILISVAKFKAEYKAVTGKDWGIGEGVGEQALAQRKKKEFLQRGPNLTDLQGTAAADNSRSATRQLDTPVPGTIDSGYRFKGGDPADPNNWEQQR